MTVMVQDLWLLSAFVQLAASFMTASSGAVFSDALCRKSLSH